MKKILLGLFAFVIVFGAVSFTSQKAQAENIFTRLLSFGSRGADVVALQEVLKNEGLLGAAATGYYGIATTEAVKKLQAQNDLEVIGKVGPKTLALVTTKVSTVVPTTITAKTTSATCTATSMPSITITSPSTGAEVYASGTVIPITWTSCNVPASTQIYISIMNGSNPATIGISTTNTGSYNYTIPNALVLSQGWSYGDFYKIFMKTGAIIYQGGPIAIDATSSNLFTINPPICTTTSPASITAVTPNGGETFIAGQQIKVRWVTCNVPTTSNINIMITMNNTSIASTAGATPNDGIEAIDLPTQANLPTGTAMVYGNVYKINLFVSGMNVSDSSDNLFTINGGTMAGCTPTSAPAIQVTSPNGGEVYTAGQQVKVMWVSCNVSSNATLTLNDQVHSIGYSLINGTSNDGSEIVTLPIPSTMPGMSFGNYYKVTIGTPGIPVGPHDDSDNLFTINAPCLNPINTVMGTPTYINTVTGSNVVTSVAYNIPLTVTSMCQTLYLGQSVQLSAIATASNAFAYAFENASAPTTLNTTSSASAVLISSDAVIQDNGYRLDNGTTKHFTISVNLTTPSALNSYYRVKLNQIRTFTNSLLSTGATNQNLIPEASYRTGYQFINN